MRTAPVLLLTQALIFPLAELVATAPVAQIAALVAATATAARTARLFAPPKRAEEPLMPSLPRRQFVPVPPPL